MTSGPAMTSVSLLATATVLPASRAAQVPARPGRADDGGDDDVHLGVAGHAGDAVGAGQEFGAAEARAVGLGGGVGVGQRDPARPMSPA